MTGAHSKRSALALLALVIAGCGLKGPLYLPDQQQEAVGTESDTKTPRKRPTTPNPAPQSQKKDAAESQAAPPDPDRPADAEPVTPPGR